MTCPGCGASIDALRAGSVTIFDERFRYFCDASCRARGELLLPEPRVARPMSSPEDEAPTASLRAVEQIETLALGLPSPQVVTEPAAESPTVDDESAEPDGPDGADADALLLVTAGAAGILALALTLVGTTPMVTGARVAIVAVGALALVGRLLARPRAPTQAHPAALLAAPVLAAVGATVARVAKDRFASDATSIAAVIVTASAILVALQRSSETEVERERQWIARALALPGRRISRDDITVVASHELRPGEELRVLASEIVPADLTVTSGEATVLPWLGARATQVKREGDPIVAGARIVTGAVSGIAGWTGHDRAWAKTLLDPARRVDVQSAVCRASRFAAEQGALAAAALAALAAFANHGHLVEVLFAALAAHASLATSVVAGVASLHVARGALSAARRGIAYRSAAAWDDASRSTAAVFVARGTLLLGEPDVVEVEPTDGQDAGRVLGWAAGADAAETHPIAVALRRATAQRHVVSDGVRTPQVLPGLGVKAVTSSGEGLLVGSRALMLEERVSIALWEARVAELEGLGRTVLLVAVGGRLVGLVTLQDGLRPGARAAVQHLLDVEVEPILLAGEARETCETIARALDIDHIRPEVLPTERAAEVRRFTEAGACVAVIGLPRSDGAVLGAATVSVALGAAGASPSEWSVVLASDDVRDAALAIALAHRTRHEARTAAAIAIAPGILGALCVSFGLLPPAFAPLAALVAGFVAVLHARTTARAHREPPVTPWDLVIPTSRSN